MGSPSTYAALMAACEKAGQWDLALALFDKMSSQVCMSFPCRAQAASVAHARNATGDKQDWAMRVVAEGRSILSLWLQARTEQGLECKSTGLLKSTRI